HVHKGFCSKFWLFGYPKLTGSRRLSFWLPAVVLFSNLSRFHLAETKEKGQFVKQRLFDYG
ncbi:MAG: hypothetical protein NT121_00120, partial [Chloroflexi bacterium]|nr:hypothetical protein [Chloroflexota bacterium]